MVDWILDTEPQLGSAPQRVESDPVSQLSRCNAAEVFPSIARNQCPLKDGKAGTY